MQDRPVIVFRLGSLGDTIFALPCFHAIRARFPGRRIVLLTNVPVSGKAAPLMAVLGGDSQFADEVIEYPISLRSIGGLLSLGRAIRASGAKTLIYLMPKRSRKQAWRDWAFLRLVGGIREVLCFPDSDDLRDVRVDPATGELEREAARLIRTCAALGPIDIEDRANWDLLLTAAEREKAAEILKPLQGRPFIAVNMGGKAAEKDWGLPNWEALRTQLEGRGKSGLLVVGGGEDHERAEGFRAGWAGPSVNACGHLSPRESGAALAQASLFIGHDSGPLHLASSVNTPAIGLFGDYNRPKQWHPVGDHVRILHRMDGLDKITPEAVMAEVDVLWPREGSGE